MVEIPMSAHPAAAQSESNSTRRIVVTLAIVAVYLAGSHIPLPGLLPQALFSAPDNTLSLSHISIFAIGVVPIFTVLVFVELLKSIVPWLNRWEASDQSNQRWMHGCLLVLALVIAGFQGNGIARALAMMPGLVETPGGTFHITIMATLIAATAILVWLASVINQFGLGHGFWVLYLTPSLLQLPDHFFPADDLVGPSESNAGMRFVSAALGLGAIFLLVAASRARNRREDDGKGHARYMADVWPPVLASIFATFFSLFLGWIFVGMDPLRPPQAFAPGGAAHLILLVLGIALFTLLRNDTEPGNRVADSPGALGPAWRLAIAQMIVCAVASVWTARINAPLDPVFLIVATALGMSYFAALCSAGRGEASPATA